jgi:hypothetical protein
MLSFKTDYEKKRESAGDGLQKYFDLPFRHHYCSILFSNHSVSETGFAESIFIARLLVVERTTSLSHSDKKLLQCSVQR